MLGWELGSGWRAALGFVSSPQPHGTSWCGALTPPDWDWCPLPTPQLAGLLLIACLSSQAQCPLSGGGLVAMGHETQWGTEPALPRPGPSTSMWCCHPHMQLQGAQPRGSVWRQLSFTIASAVWCMQFQWACELLLLHHQAPVCVPASCA